MQIQKDVNLSKYCTFKTGGNAKFFCEVSSVEDLKYALEFSKKENLSFFVIGAGSNLLISDDGFTGLVIKINILGTNIESEDEGFAIISANAGESWDDFVAYSVSHNLYGLENLSGIPGLVGASAVQNIGAYGLEAEDGIFSVEGLNSLTNEKFIFSKEDCGFNYRDSVFKKNKNLIITKINFKLSKTFVPNIEYAGLKDAFSNGVMITAQKVRDEVLRIRAEKLPDLKKLGTAGSFFKNSVITEKKYKELQSEYPSLPEYILRDGMVKIPLGFVLDKICGLKGFRKDNAGFYENQALVLMNYGNAKSSEINYLADLAEDKVFEKIGIKIEREVENVGF